MKHFRSSKVSSPRIENLESRRLLAAAHVTSIVTDNRGEVNVTFDQPLDPTTVKTTTVQMHTAGTDGAFGTADDVKITGRVKLKVNNRRIWFRPAVPVPFAAGSTYSFKVSAKSVKDAQGNRIDGEFNGPGVASGDGTAGGDLLFLSKRDKGSAPTARYSTVLGDIDVILDTVNTPQTYANFLHYADGGLWDYSIFHRSAYIDPQTPFVLQGGGFNVNLTSNDLGLIPTVASPQNEFHTSNTRGTVAMAKLGNNPNSATDQFFFNESNQNTFLDSQNGGFTVFATVKNASGLAVMDALGALQRKVLAESAHDPQGVTAKFQDGTSAFDETPVLNTNTTPSTLNPLVDLAIIRRIAVLNKYVAFPV